MQKKLVKLLPFIIILIGVFFRLYNLESVFHFTYDEEVFAFVGKRMFINGHIPLIGGVTPMHVHLAPYFYWLSGLFLYISKLNPLGWGYVSAIIAGITMLVLYINAKNMFGKYISFIAVYIYAISFYQNFFDRHYWGLVFDGLISVITLLCLFKITKKRTIYIYLLSIFLAFGIHTDMSMLVLLILTVVSLFYFKPQIKFKTYLLAVSIFLITFLPLIIFDLRHNYSNIGGLKLYIRDIQSTKKKTDQFTLKQSILFVPQSLARTLYVFGDQDLAKQYSYCQNHLTERLNSVPLWLIFLVTISIIAFFLDQSKKENEREGKILIRILFASVILGILIYGIVFKGVLYDHYLATLFPIYYLIFSYILVKFFRKFPLVILIILIMITMANINSIYHINHSFGYKDKMLAVNWAIDKTGNEDFSLDVISSCFRYNGYRYLFLFAGKEPVKSYVDANFTYLYDQPPAYEHPKLLIVITNPDFVETKAYYDKYKIYKDKTIESAKFGKVEVLLVDNTNLKYLADY